MNDAPLGLSVDRERLARVLGVDLVHIVLEVAVKEVIVEHNAVVWAERSQDLAVGALDKLVPACAVLGGLCLESVADGLQTIGGHSGDMLGGAGGACQGQGDWQADEVDVANVCEDLGAIEGELAEAKVGVEVGVRGVGDGWLDQSWARVEEKGQLPIHGEPETSAGKTGDRHSPIRAGGTERDRTVRLQGLQSRRRGVGVVWSSAIGLEKKDLVAIVDGGAGNVGIDIAGVCLIL